MREDNKDENKESHTDAYFPNIYVERHASLPEILEKKKAYPTNKEFTWSI
jgi:hypothetical protein